MYFLSKEKIRLAAIPLCAAVFLSAVPGPAHALDVRKKLEDDKESFLSFGQNAPVSPDPLNVTNEEMALSSIGQQQFLQDFSQSFGSDDPAGAEPFAFQSASSLTVAAPLEFVRRDAEGNPLFSYYDDLSSGSKEIREGDGTWVYQDGRLVSYQSPEAGLVTYQYDSQGGPAGATRLKDGVTTGYDAAGRVLRSESAATLLDYVLDGAYQGYAARETDLATGTVYFYEYTTAPDGTVSGVRRASRPLDIASDTLSVSSSRFADRALDPFLDVRFDFDDAAARAEATVSASAFDATGWAVFSATATLGKVQIYWTRHDASTGQTQSGEQTVDYAFDRAQAYRLKMSWQGGQAHVDVISGAQTSRVYSLDAGVAAWNPRFSATGVNAGISVQELQGVTNLVWQRDYQLRNLDAATPAAGRFRIDPAAPSVTFAQTWSDATAQISFWYDSRAKRLNAYTSRLNPATGTWSVQSHPPVSADFAAGVDYKFEAVFADGRLKLYVWREGASKPSADQAILDVAGFESASGYAGMLVADGAMLEVLASGSEPEPVTAVRRSALADYRRDWVYTPAGLLELYESADAGTVRYAYDNDDNLTGVTQEQDGLTTVYDADGTALSSTSTDRSVAYIRSGPYQGYPETETDLQTSETFVYEYATAADGTVTAQKRSASPLDIAGLSLNASSTRYVSRSTAPYMDVEFGFGDALDGARNRPEVTLSASAFDALERWAIFNVTAEPDRIRVYWAGASFTNGQSFGEEWAMDYAFDDAKTYRIRMSWADGEVHADLYADDAFETRIYTVRDAAWDPRFSASATDVDFRIRQTGDATPFAWTRTLRLDNLQTPSATATRVRMNPADANAAFGQTWSDAASQITARYDSRRKKLDLYVYRYDAARGAWVYEAAAPVALDLQKGVDYRTETRLENGRWLFYVWQEGTARPAAATIDLAGFDGTGGPIRAELSGEGAEVEVAGDTALPVAAERRLLPLEAARYGLYPALAKSDAAAWGSSGEYLEFFDASVDPDTGLPLSHVGNVESLQVSHAYDVALYILGGGNASEKIMQHLMSGSAFAENADYVPAGGIYSDLSQTGEWQPGFDRWNVHAGPNAWIGMAALRLYATTGNREYLDFALERAEFLRGLQQADGGLLMGPQGQFGYFANVRSTENNFSALHFFENLAAATQDPRYSAAADGVWNYVKTMYDPASGTFRRGERRVDGVWYLDAVDLFATDTVSWMPLERILGDSAFGATPAARMQEVGRMIAEAESRTAVYRPDGQIAGFSFSQSSKALGVISIEWSLQFANLYLKASRAAAQAGDAAASSEYERKHEELLNRIRSYFVTTSQGVRAAPYAVYVTGSGAYNQPTGHDFNTPSCVNGCSDVYSLPSAYFKFAVNGVDPLRATFAPILESDYL